jgi:hypothetical protein
MTHEEKLLLLKDLCARLPYGIVINTGDEDLKLDKQHQGIGVFYPEDCSNEFNERHNNASFYIAISGCYYGEEIKPYLRPISSITEKEKEDLLVTIVGNESSKYFQVLQDGSIDNTDATIQDLNKFNMHWINFDKDTVTLYFDWLNSHHFDYRGLIEKNLAIEAPAGMYN